MGHKIFGNLTLQEKAQDDWRGFLVAWDEDGDRWELRGYGATAEQCTSNCMSRFQEDSENWVAYGYVLSNDPNQPDIVETLKSLMELAEDGEWQTQHAAENSYCPQCTNDDDLFRDQHAHRPGCKYVETMSRARDFLGMMPVTPKETTSKD